MIGRGIKRVSRERVMIGRGIKRVRRERAGEEEV